MPIARSMRGDLLARAGPQWLMGIARGASLFAWGMVLMALEIPVAVLLGFFEVVMAMVFGIRTAAWPVITLAVVGIASAGQIMAAWSAIRLGTRDPAREPHEDRPLLRGFLRIDPLFLLLAVALAVLVGPLLPVGLGTLFVIVCVMVIGSAASALVAAVMLRLADLMQRVPDLRTADRLRTSGVRLVWLVPLFLALMMFSWRFTGSPVPLAPLVPPPPGVAPPPPPPPGLRFDVAAVGLAIIILMTLVAATLVAALALSFAARRQISLCLDTSRQLDAPKPA